MNFSGVHCLMKQVDGFNCPMPLMTDPPLMFSLSLSIKNADKFMLFGTSHMTKDTINLSNHIIRSKVYYAR